MTLTEVGHLAGYSDIGRTEVEPRPADPDFNAAVSGRAPGLILRLRRPYRGSGAILYRYWDALKADDTWAFLAGRGACAE